MASTELTAVVLATAYIWRVRWPRYESELITIACPGIEPILHVRWRVLEIRLILRFSEGGSRVDSASERIKDRRTGTGRRRTRTAGHRHRRIQQMEGDPYYRRLPETCRQRTQAVWVPGGRDGMEQKCEDAHTLAWEETGGSVPAARYNPSTAGSNNIHRFRPSPTTPSINQQERKYDHSRRSAPG